MGGCFKFGGYAQYAKTTEDAVVELPEDWTFAQGASVIVTFATAYYCMFNTGRISKGDSILIHACAGGVGLAAVQLAKHYNLKVLLFVLHNSYGCQDFWNLWI
jgi:NADPH:quinone reductase-like Zn-dependent oxidoreductase